MTTISLKLPEELLATSGAQARSCGVSRAEYIRRAISRMNQERAGELRRKRLAEASRKVRAESLRVNAEFAAIERDPGA
jgi:metal-responsive CopG/Arc/MetJ family transcriptional regulator